MGDKCCWNFSILLVHRVPLEMVWIGLMYLLYVHGVVLLVPTIHELFTLFRPYFLLSTISYMFDGVPSSFFRLGSRSSCSTL